MGVGIKGVVEIRVSCVEAAHEGIAAGACLIALCDALICSHSRSTRSAFSSNCCLRKRTACRSISSWLFFRCACASASTALSFATSASRLSVDDLPSLFCACAGFSKVIFSSACDCDTTAVVTTASPSIAAALPVTGPFSARVGATD